MLKRRIIEVTAFERERIVGRSSSVNCPVCGQVTELLTTTQAAALAQVTPPTIHRWLASGRAHGVRTHGGHYRVCNRSLFVAQ